MNSKSICIIIICFGLSFTTTAQNKIVFVMSAANELPLTNGKAYTGTGVFLSELYLAYKDITAAGFVVDFATPNGNKAHIDTESLKPKYWSKRDSLIKEAQTFTAENEKFNNPLSLEKIQEGSTGYQGLVIPGGQGLMVDLFKDSTVSNIIVLFKQQQKPIGLICHAPALLLSLPQNQNSFIGYKVNSITTLEEFFIEKFVMKGKPYTRKIAKQLKNRGFNYTRKGAGKKFAVRDRELITSQNPFSNNEFSALYLEALKELNNH